MKVLVDALPIRGGGGATYVQSQLAALAAVAPDLDIKTLISPWTRLDSVGGTAETVRVGSVAGRFGYEIACLPFRNADVLYCPGNFGPLRARAPIVVTIQNPNYYGSGLRLPETRPSRPRRKLWANHAALRSAAAIVAISKAMADDVLDTLPAVGAKLHVIHSGAPHWPPKSEALQDLPGRFLLAVVSAAPHKRVPDLVDGWYRARRRSDDIPSLVVVGGVTDSQQRAYRKAAAEHSGALVFTGVVAGRARMRWLYENASAAISMSALEAFPLMPAEAGSLGCPLVLSDIPSHREVSLDQAEFVPLGSASALAEVLVAHAADWVPRSRPWEWPVSWSDNAQQLRDLFDEVVR